MLHNNRWRRLKDPDAAAVALAVVASTALPSPWRLQTLSSITSPEMMNKSCQKTRYQLLLKGNKKSMEERKNSEISSWQRQ